MHSYKKSKGEDIWTVGYYSPSNFDTGELTYSWKPIRDFSNEDSAACFVNYLNGGKGNLFVEPNV